MTASPKSRLRLTLVLALAALTIFTATSLTAQEVLTNDSLVALKKAGFSDSIIISKIKSSQTKFDVSTNGLIGLKKAGMSDQVIEAVVNAGSAAAAPAAPAAAAPAAAAVAPAARESIAHLSGGKAVELVPSNASMEISTGFFDSKSELVLKGRKATYRIADKKPVFYSTWSANDAPLVRLKPGSDHDDRNLKISSGSFAPFGGSVKYGVRSEDKVDMEASERDARGLYKLTPKEPLQPGEYGFVLTYGMAAGASGRVFDFGVD
jgi:ribosomal protein L12E/L44/L45/RPP1/RPP2